MNKILSALIILAPLILYSYDYKWEYAYVSYYLLLSVFFLIKKFRLQTYHFGAYRVLNAGMFILSFAIIGSFFFTHDATLDNIILHISFCACSASLIRIIKISDDNI